jgi:hypothetical protein
MLQHPAMIDRRFARALRLLCVLATAALLAACDRCGDFFPTSKADLGACHSDAPRPQ